MRYVITVLLVAVVWGLGGFATVQALKHHTAATPSLDTWAVLVSTPGGHGSGVYIGNGDVITAAHVASHADANGKMTITDGNGVPVTGTVQWMDPDTDVALIKVDTPSAKKEGADLACSTPDPKIGDQLEAIGSPSDLVNVHTYGRVSADVGVHFGKTVFIADLTISEGSSGGPVFSNGKVVGITVAAIAAPIATPLGVVGQIVPLSVIVPRSVICNELSRGHEPPKFSPQPVS